MASHRPKFSGTIEATTHAKSNHRWQLDFELTPKEAPNLDNTLMTNFKDLDLAPEEKRVLTFQCREELFCYRHINFRDVEPFVRELIAKLNHRSRKKITLNASDMGAFICLAAAYSGEIRSDVKLTLELSDLPLKLFPVEWVKIPKMGRNISIHVGPFQTWMGEIKSLTEFPTHLPVNKQARSTNAKKVA